MLQMLGLRDDIEPPRAPNEAMFFSFLLEPTCVDPMLDFGRRTAIRTNFQGTLMNRQRLHVSLHPFDPAGGRWENQLDAADRAVRSVRSSPIHVPLDGMATFNGQQGGKCLVLTSSSREVAAYYRRLGDALTRERLPRGDVGFVPHVTLLRGRGFVEESPVANLGFTTREVVLIRSFHGQGRYDVLGRWALHAYDS